MHLLAAGPINPSALLDQGGLAEAFRKVTTGEDVSSAIGVVAFALLVWGLITALARASGGSGSILAAISRSLVLVAFVIASASNVEVFGDTKFRDVVPGAAKALGEALGGSDAKAVSKRMENFADLLYPGGDAKVDDAKVAGANRAAFYDFKGKVLEAATGAVRLMVGSIVLAIAFVALWIGWFVGLLTVWLSGAVYEFGWVLAPVAIAALGLESAKGIGMSYLMGLAAVAMGNLALALAHLGTDAIMVWNAKVLAAASAQAVESVLESPASVALRQSFQGSFLVMPWGNWGTVLLATLVLALWVIAAPVFAWKVFMQTFQRGSQFASAMGFAVAGAGLAAAGNAFQLAGKAVAAGAAEAAAGAGGKASGPGKVATPREGMPQPPGLAPTPSPQMGDGASGSAPPDAGVSKTIRSRALGAAARAVRSALNRGVPSSAAIELGTAAAAAEGVPADAARQMATTATQVFQGRSGKSTAAPITSGDTSGGGGAVRSALARRAGAMEGTKSAAPVAAASGGSRGSAAVLLGTAGAVLNRAAQFMTAEGPLPPTDAGILETRQNLPNAVRAQAGQGTSANVAAETLAVQRQQFDVLRRLAEARGL